MSQVTYFPPVGIPPRSHPLYQMTRPWITDPYCVLDLRPETGTKWVDYSGKGNHGTRTGAVFKSLGRRGDAMFFDGSNDSVDIAHAASLDDFSAISIELWCNPIYIGGAGQDRVIVNKGYANPGTFRITMDTLTAGDVAFRIETDLAVITFALNRKLKPANVWHHLVGTWDGAKILMYVDGVPGTATALVGTISGNFGLRMAGAGDDFGGLMDEFRIYRRALTASEIMSLYMMGKP